MHDFENSKFYGKNGVVNLSILENRLLNILIKNKGAFVTYKKLIECLYNKNCEDDYLINNVAVTTYRLRQKLKDDVVIKVKTNVGYMIG